MKTAPQFYDAFTSAANEILDKQGFITPEIERLATAIRGRITILGAAGLRESREARLLDVAAAALVMAARERTAPNKLIREQLNEAIFGSLEAARKASEEHP